MREIALFVEDYAHRQVIGALTQRRADEYGLPIRLIWRSAVRGRGRVIRELRDYLRDLEAQGGPMPDLLIVATDANCSGLNHRSREIQDLNASAALPPLIMAVPDPHIERWLLLDGAAFRRVFGRGCDAPEQKCSRNLYKQRLTDAIRAAGIIPNLGGIEFAEDLVQEMDLERAAQADRSLKRFLDDLDSHLRQWAA